MLLNKLSTVHQYRYMHIVALVDKYQMSFLTDKYQRAGQ